MSPINLIPNSGSTTLSHPKKYQDEPVYSTVTSDFALISNERQSCFARYLSIMALAYMYGFPPITGTCQTFSWIFIYYLSAWVKCLAWDATKATPCTAPCVVARGAGCGMFQDGVLAQQVSAMFLHY